jgi:lipoprotein-releasing system permease protein
MYKLRIAFRYLFSKKSTNAINLVTWVSMLGMGVGAFALVVVLSVFNGFEGLVVSLYNSFYPELQITTASGKFFQDTDAVRNTIHKTGTVETISATLEENAYLQYAGKDYIATVKGVDNNYLTVTSLNEKVKEGSFSLKKGDYDGTVIGANICDALSLNIKGFTEPLVINVPRNGSGTSLSPDDAFYTASVIPTGMFSIQQEFDGKYLFVSLEFMQKLMGEEQQLSALELKLKKNIDPKAAKKLVQAALGNEYQVKTKYEQKETLYTESCKLNAGPYMPFSALLCSLFRSILLVRC